MKRSRFSDQQIAFVLRQADEGKVCRKTVISEATYCVRRKKHHGLIAIAQRKIGKR